MKRRVVFFIALFVASAFINAASISESSSTSVGQGMVSSTAAVMASAQELTCENRCQINYLYCYYGRWPIDCNAYYMSCLQACPK